MRNTVILSVVVLLASFLLGLMLGADFYSPARILSALAATGPGMDRTILLGIRLPRVAAGFVVGAGLAVTGTVFQTLLRNPLAESYTLGISGGAAFGIALGVLLGNTPAVPLFAFCGALLSVGIILLAGSRRALSNPTLILTGVVLNFLFSSLVLFILAVARHEKFQATSFWLLGDLSMFTERLLAPAALLVLAAFSALLAHSRVLDVLTLGEDKAATLGVAVDRSRRNLFLISSLIVGLCVSLAGMISFVGLIVPHLVRMRTGSSHVRVLTGAFLVGGGFLIVSDALARTLIRPLEIPVGVITGFCGGLFFLFFVLKGHRKEFW